MNRYFRRLRRRLFEMFGNARYTPRPSLHGLDDKLEKYLDFKDGFFIEAGGNDGFSQSNTYLLEFGKRWRGVLVEPIPELYEKCRTLRRRSTVFNCALVASESECKSVKMHYAGLMSVSEGAMPAEQRDSHVARGLAFQGIDASYELEVPARSLEAILDEVGVDPGKIDFFSLDVEGAELGVLEGLNLSRFRPRWILVEARFFEEVNALLGRHGYVQEAQLSGHDFLYRDARVET